MDASPRTRGEGRRSEGEPGLEARDLTQRYRGRLVLDAVDLRVRPGEVVGLLGPNGAGKTTCFGALVGRLRPDRGRVHLNGRCLDGLPPWRRARAGLSELSQGSSVFPDLRVATNIEAILELRTTLGRRERRARALELLERVGMAERAGDLARNLSGGERRRLEIARVLALPPRVLLLDEPFAGVDPKTREALANLVRGLAHGRGEDSMGVLMSDHDARTVLSSCDRILLLVEGRLVVEGTPSEIVASRVARDRYLGSPFQY